jgi:sialic acid synthase SpsE
MSDSEISLPSTFQIGGKPVGSGHHCYVIAEAGSNHDRRLETALLLVDIAAEAGCDAIKFQTFTAEEIAAGYECAETRLPSEFKKWGATLQDLYRNASLPDAFHEPIANRAKERGIHFFSSPFSERAVDRLAALGVPALKIASFELVHIPLIRAAAKTGIPLILSTGMATLGDIEVALDAAVGAGAKEIALLHCGSSYPLGCESANLAAIQTMRSAFGVPVGYSDHTLGIGVPIAAATLGASLLEKHFTYDRNGAGPDHSFALEPGELATMTREMRSAELAIGTTAKKMQPVERIHALRGRRSIFSARVLRCGEVLTSDMVKVVRPGIGLPPITLDILIGRRLAKEVPQDYPLEWSHFLCN